MNEIIDNGLTDKEISERFKSLFDFSKMPIGLGLVNNKPKSERAEAVETLIKFMGETNKRFPYWCGRTKKLKPTEIYELINEAKKGKNPQSLFNWLLKNKR